jgi:hypothetical protein
LCLSVPVFFSSSGAMDELLSIFVQLPSLLRFPMRADNSALIRASMSISTVLGFKHEHSMRLGTISLKIYRSLDVNTQKCRHWVNKICVPFWCSSWIDNYKGKIIFRQISARQGNPLDRLHFTNDCFSQKMGFWDYSSVPCGQRAWCVLGI